MLRPLSAYIAFYAVSVVFNHLSVVIGPYQSNHCDLSQQTETA